MSVDHTCPCTEECPLQKAMRAIGGKWKLAIVCSLSAHGATRYNDLKRRMKDISNTMLAKPLKELEEDGLIKCTEYLEVPIRVECETTDLAAYLIPHSDKPCAMGRENEISTVTMKTAIAIMVFLSAL